MRSNWLRTAGFIGCGYGCAVNLIDKAAAPIWSHNYSAWMRIAFHWFVVKVDPVR